MKNQKHVGFEIRTISNLLKRNVDNFISKRHDENVTGIHGWVIGYIYKNKDKEIFQRDIEEEFSIRRSTATTILQLMEKNNLIVRKPVNYDARLKRLELTEKAINIHKMINQDIIEVEKKVVKGLSEEEIRMFFEITEKIKANLMQE